MSKGGGEERPYVVLESLEGGEPILPCRRLERTFSSTEKGQDPTLYPLKGKRSPAAAWERL